MIKTFTVLVADSSYIFRKEILMRIEKMIFKRHVYSEGLSQHTCVVWKFIVSKKIVNNVYSPMIFITVTEHSYARCYFVQIIKTS